jgi:hypothetical protein
MMVSGQLQALADLNPEKAGGKCFWKSYNIFSSLGIHVTCSTLYIPVS